MEFKRLQFGGEIIGPLKALTVLSQTQSAGGLFLVDAEFLCEEIHKFDKIPSVSFLRECESQPAAGSQAKTWLPADWPIE